MFLSPWLLSGLLLASAPIIIHLLNRRRRVLVDWAPMKYLKLTLKTHRRRMRIEQWLLLAIRTLAVIALFFMVARPVTSSSGFGGWLVGRTRTTRVIVLDDSLSMGYRGDRHPGKSAFENLKSAAITLLEQIGSQDSVTLLTTSAPHDPLLRHVVISDLPALRE